MTFLSPLAFLWALAAIPIFALYLLKVRQRKVTVPTLLFWDKVFQEKTPQSLFQKLRHPLSLLAQLLLLALLVLALANPLFSSSAQGARKIVLIIDNSASMRATDVSPTRLDGAKSKAKGIVDSLRYFDTLAIISVAGEPQIVSGMTDRQATLRQRIDAISPTDGPTHIAGAIDLARTLITAEKNPAIVLISDGAFDATPALTGPDIQFIGVVPHSSKPENLGITGFQARRSIADPIAYDIFLKVQSFSSKPAQCTLEVSLDDALIDAIPITLEPGQTWQQTLSKATPKSGRLRAKLIHPDALATDNLAFASLPGAARHTVDLTGTQSFFLRKAFESIPLIDIASKNPDITVLHKTVPQTLPAGNLLIIDPQSSTDLFTHAGPLLNPGIQAPSTTSPILANVQFQSVYLPDAQKLQPAPSTSPTILATSLAGDPLLFSYDRPQGRILVFAGNLDSGDFALRTAFPILLANAASWLTHSNAGFTPANLTGHSATLALTPTQPLLIDPSGHTHPLAIDSGASGGITTPVLNQAGFWTLKNNNQTIDIPVSLTDARESNLASSPIPASQTSTTPVPSGAPLWFYLLAAGLLFLGIEWFLYQRRWIN
jgi:hypothetical protein